MSARPPTSATVRIAGRLLCSRADAGDRIGPAELRELGRWLLGVAAAVQAQERRLAPVHPWVIKQVGCRVDPDPDPLLGNLAIEDELDLIRAGVRRAVETHRSRQP